MDVVKNVFVLYQKTEKPVFVKSLKVYAKLNYRQKDVNYADVMVVILVIMEEWTIPVIKIILIIK